MRNVWTPMILLGLLGSAATQLCRPGQFACGDGSCIPEEDRCNRRQDCATGLDETDCPPTTDRCTPDQFACRQSGQCIANTRKCDGVFDCEDYSDEKNCPCPPMAFRCKNGFCIEMSKKCDGTHHCQDGSDELGCTTKCQSHEWMCNDGTCIDQIYRCNMLPNCPDRSDEIGCNHCMSDQFRCNDGTCLSLSKRCDGNADCNHSEDEEACAACKPHQFRCTNADCIDEILRCDGYSDCSDLSDEENCNGYLMPTWTCRNHNQKIKQSSVCDGYPDCEDRSDEFNCTHGKAPENVMIIIGNKGTTVICPDGEYRCAEGFCVMGYKRCNGYKDCPTTGSDEENCPTTTEAPDCPPDMMRCADGFCVKGARCDKIYNCPDRSDELGCPNFCDPLTEFKCNDGGCINENLRCDGFIDCKDGSDEECVNSCPDNTFRCRDGSCLAAQRRCDGNSDCNDGSDEKDCPSKSCRDDEFDCGDQCISMDFRCDTVQDCTNGKDEEGCDVCKPDEFRCSDNSCIPAWKKCDGNSDCSANEDEEGCPPLVICSSQEMRCTNGECFLKYKQCDGTRDCSDGSDEAECLCTTNQFQCLDGQCIDIRGRCNGRSDCLDRSDEENCPTLPPTVPETSPLPFSCPYREFFTCISGDQCIRQEQQCDGTVDCRDSSDEDNCSPVTSPSGCPDGYQQCAFSTQCIRREQICDGGVDCNDMSDEANCAGSSASLNLRTHPDSQEQRESQDVIFTCRDEGPLRVPVKWERPNGQPLPAGSTVINGKRLQIFNVQMEDAGTYICRAEGYPLLAPGAQKSVELRVIKRNQTPRPLPACALYEATCSNGDCIAKNKVCDGKYDCADGSDESRCSSNGCEPNEFQCNNKKCVLKTWRCDSDNDCEDGSDEEGCATNSPGSFCQYHQFACHSNNQCIPKSYHCDTETDCVDGSDEIGCAQPVISKPPPAKVTQNVGETFQITCTSVGVPIPLISWRLNWGHIPSNCRSESVNGIGTLTCENIQESNQGAYSCEAINMKGSVLATPDTILIVKRPGICQEGYFNVQARTEGECIKCFCFGHASSCRSADLFVYQFQPAFDALKLLGVRVDPNQGIVDIRDEPIYTGALPELTKVGQKGVQVTVSEYAQLNQVNVIPFFAMPENYHGNQLKSYGGYLRYTVKHSNRGYPTSGPDVVISGNGVTLFHQSTRSPDPYYPETKKIRLFEGEWMKKSVNTQEMIASREEIMMVLEDVDNILIKLQFNEGALNTTLKDIEMDTAAVVGVEPASYVEECSCPAGYRGLSCEQCSDGYMRHETGPWLGQCLTETVSCPPGQYYDGRDCQPCACPHTNPSNQFARTCHLGSDGDVICDCPPGYVGRRCQECAQGYIGNPMVPGDSCRPQPPDPQPYCKVEGSLDTRPDAYGRCRCKALTDGPTCDQCKANTFYLNNKNQFGCIACFCMGVTDQCSSSNWYRDKISNVFTSSVNDFKLVENANRIVPMTEGIVLKQANQEIAFNGLISSSAAYFWTLPSRYLGDKITSYGGNLRYTFKNTPMPGAQSSRNSYADVEIVSKNKINLLYYNKNHSQPLTGAQTFVVPLLEQYWQRIDGQPADREHLLMVLADIEAIYIKATYYTNTKEFSLITVEMDIANERNTGSFERALEVEQCHCPTGYTGLSCEDCDIGYTRSRNGLYLRLCEPCSCNGYSNECDAETGICLNCREFTSGDNCEECLPGYSGDPGNGIPCSYQDTPLPCNCDPRGSVSNDCYNGACSCKVNVEGHNCDRCRIGTFGLNSSNIEGCEVCFCSGAARECSESFLNIEQIPIQIDDNHKFTLTDQQHRQRITKDFHIDMYQNEISYIFPPGHQETFYWSLPETFTGNQIKSYGGKLEYTQKYRQYTSGRYIHDKDVIINGNGITLYWSNPNEQRESTLNPVSVRIHPSVQWYRIDDNHAPKLASREDILIALASIDSILIRATQSSDTNSAHLSDIILDTASDSDPGQPRASQIEVCRCPLGFRGTSCESCSSGYYKDLHFDQSKPLGTCARCPCNNREESCEMDNNRRVVCYCKPGYTGEKCELAEVSVDITPKIIAAPIGSQKMFICNYTSRIDQDLDIKAEGLNLHNTSNATKHLGGGNFTFYHVVGCYETKIKCVVTDKNGYKLGEAMAEVFPGSITTPTPNPQPRPGSPTIDITIQDHDIGIYEVGNTVRYVCQARSHSSPRTVTLRWSKEGGDLPKRAVDDERGVLVIRDLQIQDSGRYICMASDGHSITTSSVTLNVGVKDDERPRIAVSQPYIEVNEGQPIEVRCQSNGIPAPELSLIRLDGQPLRQNTFDNGLFRIPQSVTSDSAEYQCIARNRAGSDSATFQVIVHESVGPLVSVDIQPLSFSGITGDIIVLRCRATGNIQNIRWSKQGGNLPYDSREDRGQLTIQNATPDMSGVYICTVTATSDTGAITTGNNRVSVHITGNDIGRFPSVEVAPDKLTISQGQSTDLQCTVTGSPEPSLKWTKVNGIFDSNTEQVGSVLHIRNARVEDRGLYVCVAENVNGMAQGSVVLEVTRLEIPRIDIYPQSTQTIIAGDSTNIQCLITAGYPTPTITWTRANFRTLSRNIEEMSNGVLKFMQVTPQDEGEYICTATNEAGSASVSAHIIVQTPPKVQITPAQQDIMRQEGDYLRLECQATGNPKPTVGWTKYGYSGLRYDEANLGAFQNMAQQEFQHLTKEDEGLYICRAESSAGIAESTIRLSVDSIPSRGDLAEAPRIILLPPRQEVNPGDDVSVNCTAVGTPPITIMWSPLNTQMHPNIYTRDGLLRFTNIQREHAGRYICKAKNQVGEAESVSEVVVRETYYRPEITAEKKQQFAVVGSNISLKCNPSYPYANSIRWLRENFTLPPDASVRDGVIMIPNVQQRDSGRYYCEVKSKEGTSSDYVDLIVTPRAMTCEEGSIECNGICIPQSSLCDASDNCEAYNDMENCQPRIRRGPESEPTITISPSENRYTTGSDVDIVCRSSENGVIPVWSRLSRDMDTDNVIFEGVHLRIVGMRRTNAGTYRCEATGSRGPYYKDITLEADDLLDQPTVEVKTAPRGSTVELVCKTDFREPITYVWSKQGSSLANEIDIYSRTIRLIDVDSSDVGTYTCTASSGSRRVEIPVILSVTGIVPYFTQAPNSYATLPTIPEHYLIFKIEISFKPENGNGLIFYNGHSGNNPISDFISLSLVDSIPEFKFNLGSGTTTLVSDRPLSDREWHTVKIERNRKKVVMYVDGLGPYTAVSSGRLVGLDLVEPLYVGGVPNSNNISPEVVSYNRYVGFVGCIGRFKIGHSFVDIHRDAYNMTGLTICEVCNESKCDNTGICQEALTKEGFMCICYTGFSGPKCNKKQGEACSSDSCGRVGKCYDSENGFECQCPLGHTGNRCEREILVVEPAFRNDAYIAYPTMKTSKNIKMTLKIKPNDLSDGILLYCSETDEGYGDFVSLAIRDKHLEFRFDAGNGPTVIRHDHEIVPGQWHILTASRSLTDGRLLVDGKAPTVERLMNRKPLILMTPLYIGGYDKHNVKLNDGVQVVSGFHGCISDISISGLDINILQNATDASNVLECSKLNTESDVDNNIYFSEQGNSRGPSSYDRRQTGCAYNPCRNGGQCYSQSSTDYQCSCLPGFIGRNCEYVANVCEQRPCANQGICKGNSTGRVCECPLGFTGTDCEQIAELQSDVHFDGNGYLEFNRDLLNHEREAEQEVIALELSTNSSNGLIFWHGQKPYENGLGQDYISLALRDGYLEFSYDLGNGPAILLDTRTRLNDGKRYRVVLKRQGQWGSMEIDDQGSIEHESRGAHETMSCTGNIYLGGTPDINRMTGEKFTSGFDGCIHGFELQDSQRLDFGIKAIGGMNVKACSRFDDSLYNMIY